MKTKAEKLKLIEETVLYYSENPLRRCINTSGNCFYFGGNNEVTESEGCAIGRIMPKEFAESLDNEFKPDFIHSGVRDIFSRLPKDVKEYGKSFLCDLQALHDSPSYWDKEGLTFEGGLYMEDMIEKHNLHLI